MGVYCLSQWRHEDKQNLKWEKFMSLLIIAYYVLLRAIEWLGVTTGPCVSDH